MAETLTDANDLALMYDLNIEDAQSVLGALTDTEDALRERVCACVRVCVCACVRVCMRAIAPVRGRVQAFACVRVRSRVRSLAPLYDRP